MDRQNENPRLHNDLFSRIAEVGHSRVARFHLANGATERNHEAFANDGAFICAPGVKRLLKKN